MNKNISTIVFDFDGVIVDSVDSCILAFKEYFDKGWINKEFKNKYEFKKYFNRNKSFTESLNEIITSEENKKRLQDHHRNKNRYYLKSSLVNNSKEIIEYLNEKSYLLGVVSSNFNSNIEYILNRENIKEYFKFIISGDTNLKGKDIPEKPSPRGILYGLESISVKPENAIFVGDSGMDIIAGKKANVGLVVAKASDESDYEYFLKFKPSPDKVIKNLEEIRYLV